MVPELMWKAMDIYFKIFDKLWNFYPFTWDPSTRTLSKISTLPIRAKGVFFYFCFCALMLTLIMMILHFILMIISEKVRADSELKMYQLIILVFLLVAIFLGYVSAYTTVWKPDELVGYLEQAKKHANYVQEKYQRAPKPFGFMDKLTLLAVGCMIPVSVLTVPGIPAFSVVENVDPLYPWIHLYFKSGVHFPFIRVLRAIILYIVIAEMWRNILLWSYITFITFTLRNNILLALSKDLKVSVKFQMVYQDYNRLRILNTIDNDFLFYFVPTILGCGVWIIVICSFSAIILHSRLELPFFLVMLSIAIAGICIALTLIPLAINAYEYSIQLLNYWKWKVINKHDRKLLRSCRPLRVQAGPPFYFQNSTKGTFWSMVFMYIVNLIISVPV